MHRILRLPSRFFAAATVLAIAGCASHAPERASSPAPAASAASPATALTDVEKQFLDSVTRRYDDDIANGVATDAMKEDALEQARYLVTHWRQIARDYRGRWVVVMAGNVFADDSAEAAIHAARTAHPDREYILSRVGA